MTDVGIPVGLLLSDVRALTAAGKRMRPGRLDRLADRFSRFDTISIVDHDGIIERETARVLPVKTGKGRKLFVMDERTPPGARSTTQSIA